MPDDTPDTQICCGLVLPIDRECPVCGDAAPVADDDDGESRGGDHA